MVDWKIARRRDRCSGCESVFEEGQRQVSTLSLRAEDLVREDLCLPCWEQRGAGDEIIFWYTRQSSERRGFRLDLPLLEQLFLRLEDRDQDRMLELRYVLCLLLMRKKRLKLLRVTRDPRETLVVRRPRREEALKVVVCGFGAERMEELQRTLVEVFDGAEGLPFSAGEGKAGGSHEAGEEVPPAATVGA
jgi:hypothetical protein